MDNNKNNGGNDRNEINALVIAHVMAQGAMYAEALQKCEGGYEQKTNIWEVLSVAETSGPVAVAEVVAATLAGCSTGLASDPVAVLCDLIMALKYKSKFYDKKRAPHNVAVCTLNEVYNNALDAAHGALYNGHFPEHVATAVEEFIYDYD